MPVPATNALGAHRPYRPHQFHAQGHTLCAVFGPMSDDRARFEPPPDHAEERRTDAEDELRALTTTAAHDLAILREAMVDRPLPPESLSVQASQAREALRHAVVAYVQSLRGEGATPVQTLVKVKSAVEPQLRLPRYERRACIEDVVRWAVDAYYDT